MADAEALRPEVLLPPTVPGTEVALHTRSGVEVVVVAERVGLPYRVRPMALSLTLLVAGIGLLAALTWDDPAGEEPSGPVMLLVQLAALVAAWLAHRLVSPVQRWAVRRASERWKVGVVAPDPGRAPRGQWVLHSERLPAGADPRARLDALVEEVRSGGFDVHRRVLGIRASLR
ncbi:hypothetical protein [Phycicoccus avicenniae]|uniref:hypothetical protein n=1 Tax=Phycicoccus avicenniae TaxID=2828860 RepID=UPI003D2A0733